MLLDLHLLPSASAFYVQNIEGLPDFREAKVQKVSFVTIVNSRKKRKPVSWYDDVTLGNLWRQSAVEREAEGV